MQIVLYIFTAYVGLAMAIVLFGNDKRSRRAERVLRMLLSVFTKSGPHK
jgi:hypothetical protein